MSLKGKKDLEKHIGKFMKQYARKAQKGIEPNDRSYDRKIEKYLKQLSPEALSDLMNKEDK